MGGALSDGGPQPLRREGRGAEFGEMGRLVSVAVGEGTDGGGHSHPAGSGHARLRVRGAELSTPNTEPQNRTATTNRNAEVGGRGGARRGCVGVFARNARSHTPAVT